MFNTSIKDEKVTRIVYKKNGTFYATDITNSQKVKLKTLEDNVMYSKVKYFLNGKRIFYSIVNGDYDEYTLKYYDITSNNSNGTIDNEIINDYIINESGTLVFYKKLNKELYYSNLKTKTKIADNVDVFRVTPDGSKVIYYSITDTKTFIYNTKKKKHVLIDEDSRFVTASKDLNEIYIIKQGKLNLYKNGVFDSEILAGVSSLSYIYESGEIYYNDLDNQLCYFDKQNTTVIMKDINMRGINLRSISFYNPSIVFNKEGIIYMAYKDKVKHLDIEITLSPFHLRLNNSGTCVYYLNNYNDDNGGDLTMYDAEKDTITVLDSNVYMLSIIHNTDKCIYIKKGEGTSKDLYIDKKIIDTNVSNESIFCDADGNVCYVKYGTDGVTKNLYLYSNDKTTLVAENYSTFHYYNSKAIIYLKASYNESLKRDLYLYNGKEMKLMDSEVSSFFSPVRQKYDREKYTLNPLQFGYDVYMLF